MRFSLREQIRESQPEISRKVGEELEVVASRLEEQINWSKENQMLIDWIKGE